MKTYKDLIIPDLIKELKEKAIICLQKSDVNKGDRGQLIIPTGVLFIEPHEIVTMFYCRDKEMGRQCNKLLKAMGYYTKIIIVRSKSIVFWVSTSPEKSKEKYGSYF
jgi:hypothetical protein